MRDPKATSRLAIQDMLDAMDVGRKAIAGLTFAQFEVGHVNRLAAERSVEIVSEASRRVSDELKAAEPQIPWPKVAAIGNVLRHQYREVAPLAVWNVIAIEFPILEAALRRILAAIEEE